LYKSQFKKSQTLSLGQVFPTVFLSVSIFIILLYEYLSGKNLNQVQDLVILVVGIILLLILTVYIFVIKQQNLLLAKSANHTPIKNMESFSMKSSIGHLSESMVHEINNPLEIINQNAGLLKDILNMSADVKSIGEMKLKEKFVTLTDGILEGVDRSRKVMNRFLKFAKNIQNEKLDVNVNIILNDLIDLCKEEVMFRNINIERKLDQDIPHILSGANLVQHLFFNILSFIISDVMKDTSIVISSEALDNSFMKVIFSYSKIMSNTNKRASILAFNEKRNETLKQNDIKLTISKEFIEKLNGRMQVVAQNENSISIILIIPTNSSLRET
jgi:two-component system NtrC family sensor kinase